MTEDTDASELINKEQFDEFWDWFKEHHGASDQNILHGYMILKAGCVIIEEAFGMDPVEAQISREE